MMTRWPLPLLLCLAVPGAAMAHTMTLTQVLVSFDRPDMLDVKIDIDPTMMLGTPELYYKFATDPPAAQQATLDTLLPKVLGSLQLFAGNTQLVLVFQGFSLSDSSKADYLDASMSKLTSMRFLAALPANRLPLRLEVPVGADVEFPVAYTVQIPSGHISVTRWLEGGEHVSDPFAWADRVPKAGAAPAPAPAAAAKGAGTIDVDALPWTSQLALYLRLGFRHIVPGGLDHILFVLGLFFLGITWRKLIAQTSVFTVAHATTLFLSTYGIFRVSSQYVEPAIALSIAFIALENVFTPRLGPGRLAVVFGFGLVHGLGFAKSLGDLPLPKHDFIVALLGFNFGVDAGQLFVIALAFLAVGRFRDRPWFRSRIAIPFSLIIAAIGLFWAVRRIIFYSHS
jgi:HupE / UreJ protein